MGIATFAEAETMDCRARSYTDRGRPVLLIAEPAAAAPFEAAIARVGARLLQRIGWADVAATLPMLAGRPTIVAEASAIDPVVLDTVLPLVTAHMMANDVSAVIAFDEPHLDLVARHLLGLSADMLCRPTAEQRVASLAATLRPPLPALHDRLRDAVQTDREPFQYDGRDSAEERLRRLTEGMERISRFAADVMRHSGVPADLGDRRTAYDSEPATAGLPVRAQDVRRVIHRRQLRSKFFGQFGGEALFEDPAWDMLLDLFAAELEGVQVSVSSLCIAAGVAPTTALRWIAKMTEMELFIRHPDPADRRRAFMTLSPRASEAMHAYMIALRKIEAAG
ncbi:MarR family winged helix-turn-helix transcriptional regulator [Sphingomonas melonis]|uniref:DNA-binding MarR family transcriptional regulator n=1 Tax=Sphingomonas melonis TaxID=152682 RepID=A0A7Y9FKC5_9SPHN|nr:MarR family winged helix-turn-helix transcriptional regulator [Sphingomonas melonis]NYD88723.1 DNA-binding MarR family transcriptional regulator [Sphingomonas melonis]